LNKSKSKGILLKLRAFERMHLKICVWKSEFEERAPEDTSSEARLSEASHQKPLHQS